MSAPPRLPPGLISPSSCVWTLPEPPSASPASQHPESTYSDILQAPSLSLLRGLQVSEQAPPVPTPSSGHTAILAGTQSPQSSWSQAQPHSLASAPASSHPVSCRSHYQALGLLVVPTIKPFASCPPQTSPPQHHHLRGAPSMQFIKAESIFTNLKVFK